MWEEHAREHSPETPVHGHQAVYERDDEFFLPQNLETSRLSLKHWGLEVGIRSRPGNFEVAVGSDSSRTACRLGSHSSILSNIDITVRYVGNYRVYKAQCAELTVGALESVCISQVANVGRN